MTDNLQKDYETLNDDQRRIVDKVVNKVCTQKQSINLFVSGQGGTGKSPVIDVLDRMVCSNCSTNIVPVVVTAPTGLAAFNVSGTTTHRTTSRARQSSRLQSTQSRSAQHHPSDAERTKGGHEHGVIIITDVRPSAPH